MNLTIDDISFLNHQFHSGFTIELQNRAMLFASLKLMPLSDLPRILIRVELVALFALLVSTPVDAHGGHGNEFAGQDGQVSTTVQIDQETAQRIGIQVTAAKNKA
jgi:hypothetical protein